MTTDEQKSALRRDALLNFYAAERRAGTSSLEAHERQQDYAARLDRLFVDTDINVGVS